MFRNSSDNSVSEKQKKKIQIIWQHLKHKILEGKHLSLDAVYLKTRFVEFLVHISGNEL